ncbi:MAG: M24 family metallopeptidase [Proteobacteria bacterium]|nr:M24 family metallopeptidase [Pseudomonadota bacterium]
MKKSGEIISHVFEKAKSVVREGMREVDIAAILESEGRMHGHQGFLRMRGLNQEMMNIYITHGFSGTVVSGFDVPISGAGVTHAIAQGPSVNKVQRSIPLLIDYGGGYNGYITDETRAFVVGELKEIFIKAHEVAREIIEETMSFAKEGVNAPEIFRKALYRAKREKLEEYFMGYGEGKVGFIGHGLGLEINELPVITPRHDVVLKEGMVFAFEPKFIFPNEGAIGIEVDFIVRQNYLERVTDTPIDVVQVDAP